MGDPLAGRGVGGIDNWQAKFKKLTDRLLYALNNEEFADVVFLVGPKKERVRCNKFMLCISSSVFATMLNCRWHSDNTEILIPDTEPIAFRTFLKYLYTEEIIKHIYVDDAISVAYLAKKYDVPKLVEKCVLHMKMNLNTGNAATIFQKSRFLQETSLEKIASEFICRNAKRVFAADDYLELTLDNLSYFLALDELKIDELSLVIAVYNWAQEECKRGELEQKPENYRLVLKDAVDLIRFPLLTAEEFTFQVADKGILPDSDVISILKYYSVAGSKATVLPELIYSSTPRTPLFSNVRYCISRYGSVRSSTQSCDSSNPKRHCFLVNRPISIVSIGLFGPNEKCSLPVTYEAEIKIQDYDLKSTYARTRRTVILGKEHTGKTFPVEFDTPAKVNPFLWYTISYTLKGPNTIIGDDKKSEVKIQCGFDEMTFRFKEAKENNTTSQIAEICFVLF